MVLWGGQEIFNHCACETQISFYKLNSANKEFLEFQNIFWNSMLGDIRLEQDGVSVGAENGSGICYGEIDVNFYDIRPSKNTSIFFHLLANC